MKFLLSIIGLICYIAGLFYLIKDNEQRKKSSLLILAGGLLMTANVFFLWNSVNDKIAIGSIVLVIVFVFAFIYYTYLHYNFWYERWTWGFQSLVVVAVLFSFNFTLNHIPSVTLDNDIIEMSGKYGGVFKISDIQSVDTVSVHAKPLRRRGGGNGPITHYGNFDVQNEKKLAKLCIYLNKPPYINIRMNDGSLFILNFKDSDKTVEFYNKLKNIQFGFKIEN